VGQKIRKIESLAGFKPMRSQIPVWHSNLWRSSMASWLVRSSPDRVVWIRALARDTAVCSWGRHLTLTVLLSSQVFNWVLANLMPGVNLLASHPGGE